MDPRITIIILAVADVKRSTKFYLDLGFPLDSEGDISSFFNLSGLKLGILDQKYLETDAGIVLNTKGYSPFNLTHTVNHKKDVDIILKKAEKLGGKIVRPPTVVEWGAYSGFFADPDNHLWEIFFHKDWIPK